jgi:DNA-binding NtrC family response regulator
MMTAAYVGGRGVEDGMTSIQKAVEALTLGAYDYTLKPANEFVDKVKISVQNALRERQAVSKVAQLREQLIETAAAFANLIGDSPRDSALFLKLRTSQPLYLVV